MATKYGFIGKHRSTYKPVVYMLTLKSEGLGSMGFGMCSNIHAKIKPDDQLFIYDINQSALNRFVQESKGQAKIETLTTPKGVAEQCVREMIFRMDPRYIVVNALIAGHYHYDVTEEPSCPTSLLRRRQQYSIRKRVVQLRKRNEAIHRMQHHRSSSVPRSRQ
jgi:hypothetical protein